MSVHVCILSAAHQPGDGRVTHKIGKGLRDAGFKVTWIGPGRDRPEPDHGIDFKFLAAEGGLAARYRRVQALFRAAAQLQGVDVWFAVEPDSAAVGVKLARGHGGRSVFDIHEVYHDDMLKGRVPSPLQPVLGLLIKWKLSQICRKCDLIIGAGVTRIAPFESVARRSMVVRHCLSRAIANEPSAAPFDGSRDFVRVLHGKASLSQGTRQMMEAAAHLRRKGGPKLRVLMFRSFLANEGFGIEQATALAADLGIDDLVEWHDPVPFHDMFGLMRTCDLGTVTYTRQMGVNCMPNRIFEYMALGLPVICPAFARELVPILEETKCGILAETESSEMLAKAIVDVCSDPVGAREMGSAGRRAFQKRFNMEQELQPFVEWVLHGLKPAG